MAPEEEVVVSPLFIGMTRPAMMGGIPASSWLLCLMGSMATFLVTHSRGLLGLLIPVLLFFVLYAVCYLAHRFDRHLFEILFVRLDTCRPQANRRFWGYRSYQP